MISDFKNRLVKIGVLRFFSSLFSGSNFGYKITESLHNAIISKLESDYSDIIHTYKNYNESCAYNYKSPVWVFWMQGYDKAPVLVKKCIDSIRKSTSHPVLLITKDNIDDYLNLPEYITRKYNQGIITNAQFSDILRMSLLSEYGGLWIDATVFVPKKIPEEVFYNEYYTCKRHTKKTNYVSKYRWTSFVNGCQKGCIIQKVMADLFLAYWKNNDYLIDYLLVDYFMAVVYNNFQNAKSLVDNLKYNNSMIDELQSRMNLEYSKDEYDSLINQTETFLFKLSWRMEFREEINNAKTYYGYLLSS